jgi:hypothetical protein
MSGYRVTGQHSSLYLYSLHPTVLLYDEVFDGSNVFCPKKYIFIVFYLNIIIITINGLLHIKLQGTSSAWFMCRGVKLWGGGVQNGIWAKEKERERESRRRIEKNCMIIICTVHHILRPGDPQDM